MESKILKIKKKIDTYYVGEYVKKVDQYKTTYHCSNCNKTVTKYFKYCPYCGVEFKGLEEIIQ